MRYRKLTNAELDFIELNSNIIEIVYYPKYAKSHKGKPSTFNVKKGFAFIFSNKILRKFNKCEIIDIIEHERFTVKHYKSLKEAILGKE